MSVYLTLLQIGTSLVDILFPSHCIGCKKRSSPLCSVCLGKLSTQTRELPAWIESAYDYRDPVVRQAIWQLKFKNTRGLASILASELAERILADISEGRAWRGKGTLVMIPIPLYRDRKQKRGYNQAELIARALKKKIPTLTLRTDLLYKVQSTEHQSHIRNKYARMKNAEGMFAVRQTSRTHTKKEMRRGTFGATTPTHILLIDDVTTTGATLSAAKKVLLAAGAKSVKAYTLAH
jgi:ComF family protein